MDKCFLTIKTTVTFAASNQYTYYIQQTMTREEVINRINGFLVEDFEVEPESIQPQAALKETLDLDSLDYVDLIVTIDNTFGFKVKPEEFQQMTTIADFYEFVCEKLNINSAA